MDETDYIYSTVPEHFLDQSMDRMQALHDFLLARKGRFFPARQLAKEVGFDTRNTCVALRQAITHLIHDRKAPIVANAKGYGYAVHPNQVRHYIDQLEYRKNGIDRRILALQEIMSNLEAEQ